MGSVIYNLVGGGGGYFQAEGQKKYCCVRRGHYKIRIYGRCVLSTLPDQQKSHNAKMRKKCKKYQTLKIFPRSFRSLGILQNSYFWSS